MRSRPSETNRVPTRRGVGCREFSNPGFLRHFAVVVNKRLDLINSLLYTLSQSLPVDVLQILYRN
jgi:hypothetical protein